MAQEAIDDKQKNIFTNKSNNLLDCCNFWDLDIYHKAKIKDILSLNRCKDRYCNNCKKVKQANNIVKYGKHLLDGNTYHLVLTIPNVLGPDLKKAIKQMALSFRLLYGYLSHRTKLKDFNYPKATGALRSLEVTCNNLDNVDYYHPHYHVILKFDTPLNLQKNKITKFSYSYGELVRKFSDFELAIGNIWFNLYNNINLRYKQHHIYSTILDKADDNNIKQVLKYITKDKDLNNNIITYKNFKTIYEALYRVKQLQGYGDYYNIKDTDEIDLDLIYKDYNYFLKLLTGGDNPIRHVRQLNTILGDNSYTYYSKFKYLRDIKNID